MVNVPSEESIRRALLVIAWVAAANSTATPEQRVRLKETVEVLRDDSYSAGQAYEMVIRGTAAIMGPDWMPEGEWDTWIKSLLAGSPARSSDHA